MDVKQVALNDVHQSLGAKMIPFAGYNMPVRYSSDIEEHMCVRNDVGVFDVSHMGEFIISGEKALELIQHVTSNDASTLEDGGVQYSYLPNEKGGIIDDLLVYRVREGLYYLVVNASNMEKDWNWISSHNPMGAKLENISEHYSLLAIQGPKAAKALQPLTDINLADMKYYNFEMGNFAGKSDVMIAATGYTGSGGFEIMIKNEDAVEIWNEIFRAGAPQNIKPIGLGARDTLRLEKGYCLYGNDIDDHTSPIEAGLGWVTKFTKDFIAKDIIAKVKEDGPKKKLVGFTLEERGIPRSHYLIEDAEENIIGEVTSGSMSPCLNKGIGMAYIQTAFTKPETEIYIAIRKNKVKARISKFPIYKG